MAKGDDLRTRLARRIVNAGVAVAVDQDDVSRPAEATDDREVGLIAGAEDHRVALAEPLREIALQLLVDRQRPVSRPRAGGSGAVLSERLARRLDDLGVQRQPEVIVRAEHQRRAAVDDDLAGAEDTFDHGRAGNRRARREQGTPPLDGPQLVEQIHRFSAHARSPP